LLLYDTSQEAAFHKLSSICDDLQSICEKINQELLKQSFLTQVKLYEKFFTKVGADIIDGL
jgi:hypothetical protein